MKGWKFIKVGYFFLRVGKKKESQTLLVVVGRGGLEIRTTRSMFFYRIAKICHFWNQNIAFPPSFNQFCHLFGKTIC